MEARRVSPRSGYEDDDQFDDQRGYNQRRTPRAEDREGVLREAISRLAVGDPEYPLSVVLSMLASEDRSRVERRSLAEIATDDINREADRVEDRSRVERWAEQWVIEGTGETYPRVEDRSRVEPCKYCGTELIVCIDYHPDRKCCPDCEHREDLNRAEDRSRVEGLTPFRVVDMLIDGGFIDPNRDGDAAEYLRLALVPVEPLPGEDGSGIA